MDTASAAPAVIIEATVDGVEVVFGSRGYDTDEGYRLTAGYYVAIWHAKSAAAKVAAALGDGWCAVRAHTALSRGLWVVHRDAGGGFLTRDGYATVKARRAAEHFTKTYATGHRTEPYNVNSRGMTGYRVTFHTTWACTCGAGGFGEDRDRASARARAAQHRADPGAAPGQPWNPATVAGLRTERAV